MAAKQFARATGVVYTALGVASLVPALSTKPRRLPRLHLDQSYGLFLGVFPQNIINKVAILGFGAAGLAASSTERRSRVYAGAVFAVMGAAGLLGVLPSKKARTFFGYWPLWGAEAALHGANALLGALFAFSGAERARVAPRRPAGSWASIGTHS